MSAERCPDCGKLISFRFPLHDCKPLKENEPTLLAGKKPAKFRAPEPTNGVEFVCGIHARAFNKYYERKGKSIRCEPISREEK
jgi:hypothetical protein